MRRACRRYGARSSHTRTSTPRTSIFPPSGVAMSGGSALPIAMMEKFRDRYGVQMSQGWGMTETSPVCAFALVGAAGAERRGPLSAGRLLPGVEARIVAPDGTVAPWDGVTVGELEVRGPWVTGSYLGGAEPGQFHAGWLRTGDLGALDEDGYLYLSDRLKDTIKSGGEWISSMRLEDELMAHPGVLEAAVVGVPDERWGERPLAVVVRRRDTSVSVDELRAYIGSKVVRWWALTIGHSWTSCQKPLLESTTSWHCAPVTLPASSRTSRRPVRSLRTARDRGVPGQLVVSCCRRGGAAGVAVAWPWRSRGWAGPGKALGGRPGPRAGRPEAGQVAFERPRAQGVLGA